MIDLTDSSANQELSDKIQLAAEQHLELCMEWCEFNEWGGTEGLDIYAPTNPDPSVAPFCGCVTCIVREVLSAAIAVLEQSE